MPHLTPPPSAVPHGLAHWVDIDRERVRTLGFRADCIVYHIVRCAACLHRDERVEPWDALPHQLEFGPIVEKLVRKTELRTGVRCIKCNAPHVFYDGESHVIFANATHRDLHLALEVSMRMTSDGVARTTTACWQVTREGLVPFSDLDAVLPHLYAEEEARRLTTLYPLLTLAEARGMEDIDTAARCIALREYGKRWSELGEYAHAWECLDAALHLDEAHLPTLLACTRLLERAGDYAEASQRLHQHWAQHENPQLLEALLRCAARADRPLLLQQAASLLLEHDPDAVAGFMGLAVSQSAQKINLLRRALQELASSADQSGESAIAAVADAWAKRIPASTPSWEHGVPRSAYLQELLSAWRTEGYTLVATHPTFEAERGLRFQVDALIEAPDGTRIPLWLLDGPAAPHVVRALRGCLQGLYATESLTAYTPLILSPYPLPWTLYRAASSTPDARLERLLDADHTMQVRDENIETFREYALQAYGLTLDFSDESLNDIDHLIGRWRKFGFGEISHTLACLCASYLDEYLSRRTTGGWVDSPDGPDARAWRFHTGTLVYLIAHIKQSVALTDNEPIRDFLARLLESER